MRRSERQFLSLRQAWTACSAIGLIGLMVVATACDDDPEQEDVNEPIAPEGETADAGDAKPRIDAATMPRADGSFGASPTRTDAATSNTDGGGANRDSGASTVVTNSGASAAVVRGAQIAKERECSSCHQESYAGSGFFPNISSDPTTGIGGWSDQEIGSAITMGVARDGGALCALMMRYMFSASELSDLIAFLRNVPPKSKRVTEVCPAS